jgi:hypothetical protein
MEKTSVQVHRCSLLFWTPYTFQAGISNALNVPDHLLTFLVFNPRQEGTDKRFDSVTLFRILQSSSGPARDELRIKGFFPSFWWAKKGDEFLRDVLETPAVELAHYFSQLFLFIHRVGPPTIDASTVARA